MAEEAGNEARLEVFLMQRVAVERMLKALQPYSLGCVSPRSQICAGSAVNPRW